MFYIFVLAVLGYIRYRLIKIKLRRFFMKIRYYIAYLLIAVMMIAATGITVFLMFRAYSISANPGMKYLEFYDAEKDLSFAPDANKGFVVNPYQSGNPDQNQAVMGALVSYIMKEVRVFTIFAVILAVLALITYIVIAFIFLKKITGPTAKAEDA